MENLLICTTCEQPLQNTQKFCANCGNAIVQNISPLQSAVNEREPEDVHNHLNEESIKEIRLQKPIMIGKISLKDLLWVLFAIFFGYQSSAYFGNIWIGLFFILCGVVMFLASMFGYARVKKRCPYCREKTEFRVNHSLHSCSYCQKEMKVKWVNYFIY